MIEVILFLIFYVISFSISLLHCHLFIQCICYYCNNEDDDDDSYVSFRVRLSIEERCFA